jgi:hypothetical protein
MSPLLGKFPCGPSSFEIINILKTQKNNKVNTMKIFPLRVKVEKRNMKVL